MSESSSPSASSWRLCWIPAPHLQLTHAALVTPGGVAAERAAGIPSGTSHLLEHLLYRQNSLEGDPFDHLGGKFGLLTERERMTAYLAFQPSDSAGTLHRLRRWWDELNLDQTILAEECEVVADEIRNAGGSALHLVRSRVIGDLTFGTHLHGDFIGSKSTLISLNAEELRVAHQKIRALGAAIVALGPIDPWKDLKTDEFTCEPWRVAVEAIPQQKRVRLRGGFGSGCLIVSACLMPGLTSPDVLASYSAFAALAYGRKHPSQIGFHRKLRLRTLDVSLQMFAGTGLLSAYALCDVAQVTEVCDLIEDLLTNPVRGSTADRIARSTRHHLASIIDNPHDHVVSSATNLLHGVPLPGTLLELVKSSSPEDLARSAASSVRSGPVTYILERGSSKSPI